MNNNLEIIDSHAHLDFKHFENNLHDVIQRAYENGVTNIISISTKLSELEKTIKISDDFKNVWFSVGIHPHEAEKEKDACNLNKILDFANNKKCVAIGEAGLDFYYNYASSLAQKVSFKTQIEASRQLNLPIIIHSRDADDDLYEILQEEMINGKFNGVLHCFSSGRDLAIKSIELGLFISFSGILTFKNAINLQKLAYEIPLEKILIETDSPFLSPVPLRGKVNEPSNTIYVLKKLSEIRGIPIKELSKIIKNNTLRLFNRIII